STSGAPGARDLAPDGVSTESADPDNSDTSVCCGPTDTRNTRPCQCSAETVTPVSCGGRLGSSRIPFPRQVLDGEPDHLDSVLSEVERRAGDCMLICVSRSCGARLVLDL